ncbi:MAG: hypothetical protein DMD87_05225 [Candidatus Rokuibacteriota bacterium]|nr:MAG: hypothetical protein DMD87_05225 [Candidatus Rokubacteria bacterium]
MYRTLCAVASILAIVCLVAPVVDAAPGFSAKDVDGPTAFDFDGFVTVLLGGTPTTVPAAAMGRFVADGDGSITDGVRTLVAGGAAIRQTFTCSYTVNPDGTGSARCTVITEGFPNSVETFDFVIVERKKEAFFTSTTAGSTIRGRTKRQQ